MLNKQQIRFKSILEAERFFSASSTYDEGDKMENLGLMQFGQLVYNYCGLNYLKNLSSLDTKMKKRLKQLNLINYWEYIGFIEKNKNEWVQIIELLTINETYFYREDKQLTVLQNKIAPQLLRNSDTPLTIWSAGCSTGDEPYSIAILLHDQIKMRNKIHILGTDINQRVLEVAKNGAYNKNSLSFRRIPETWISTYFNETDSQYIVKEIIRQNVTFDTINLFNVDQLQLHEKFDVIFCRNVLIYFDEQTIKKIVTAFYKALKPGGFLFLGHSETITKLDVGFQTINLDGTFYYQKG